MYEHENSKNNNKLRLVRPEYACSYVLRKLKEAASDSQNNRKMKMSVVTIPVHFSERSRQAMIDAIKIAGLDRYEILEEPVAAILELGLDKYTG